VSAGPLRIALIGCGRIAFQHARGFRGHPEARIVALCNRTVSKAEQLAREERLEDVHLYARWEEMLDREPLDAVSIILPDQEHDAVLREALERGLHVLCEKPLALTGARADRLAALARRSGVTHGVRLHLRSLPAYRYIRDWIERGGLGRPFHARMRLCVERLSNPEVELEWRMRRESGGYGALSDLGSHMLDLLDFLLPEQTRSIRSVSGAARIFYPTRKLPGSAQRGKVTAPDAAAAVLVYGGGTMATLEVSRFVPGEQFFQVDGSLGSARSDGARVELYEKKPTEHQQPTSEFTAVSPDELEPRTSPTLFEEFVDCCRSGRPFSPDFDQGARLMRNLDRIYRRLSKEYSVPGGRAER
jgi:predicted dehydrogenase